MIASRNFEGSVVRPLFTDPEMEATAAISPESNDVLQTFSCRLLRSCQVSTKQLHIVEQKDDKMPRPDCRVRAGPEPGGLPLFWAVHRLLP